MRERREQLGWSQGDLAKASSTYAQTISKIELGRTRITEDKARRLSDALGVALDEMFLCVIRANTAASRFGVGIHTLIAAVRDPDSPITAHAVETKDAYQQWYFVEDDLREQLSTTDIRRKMGRRPPSPVGERLWLLKDEVVAATGRGAATIDQAIRDGELRAWKIGGRVLIPKSDVAAWEKTFPDWSVIAAEMFRLYETGLTCAEVGVRMGYTYGVVRNRLRASGYTLRPGAPRGLSEAHAEALRRARSFLHNGEPTRIEIAGRTLLTMLGVEFIEQYPVGVYTVDFYIPKIQCVVEADGWYWHQNEAKEKARDAYLLRDPSVRSVVHLTEEQLKPWTPKERTSTFYRNRKAAILAA